MYSFPFLQAELQEEYQNALETTSTPFVLMLSWKKQLPAFFPK